MTGIHLKNTETYLTYDWLVEHGISINSIEAWVKRNICKPFHLEGRSYINYDSIPAPSRAKLPTKETIRKIGIEGSKASFDNYLTDIYYKEIYIACQQNWTKYRQQYEEYGFDAIKVTEYARLHAVWSKMLEMRDEREKGRPIYKPGLIYAAYKRICPDGYTYAYMSNAYKVIREKGIPALLVQESRKGNEYAKKYDDWHKAFILKWMSSGKAYNAVLIQDKLAEECRASGKPIPSYTWVKARIFEYKESTGEGRYGQNAWNAKNAPYCGIIKALNPNTQWAGDGWKLPFYLFGWERLTIYAVMDSHSGYIIDYDIAKTENAENILRALNRSVEKAGCLPHELVTDKHSFTKTSEAEYFNTYLEKLGCTWTIDSNPRRKGIIERRLGVFGNRFMKEFPGYIGQGIKTKDPNGHTSQEELDKYTKAGMWRTEDEIRIYAHLCVEAYNKYIAEKDKGNPEKKSCVELYENPDQPHKIPVSIENRLRLFVREATYKAQRGQINIKRELELNEFQLNAELIAQYNNKHLKVRYESLDEIYIFDPETDECLGSVKPKRMAHGALADQTEEDVKIFNQNKGRLKGYRNALDKKQEAVLKNVDPEAAYRVNPMVCKKIDIEELAQNGKLSEDLKNHGVDLNYVPQPIVKDEDNSYKAKSKKVKQATEVKNHKTGKVSLSETESESSPKVRKDQPFTDPNVKIKKLTIQK